MTFRDSDYTKQGKQFARIESLDGWTPVQGYDFNQPFDFNTFLAAYATTGIQATNLAKGIELCKQMRAEKATIFLSCTSNMGSSGIRDIIRYLVQHKKVDVLVMSAGAVEEDVIKTLKPFVVGNFDVPGRMLFEKGVGRIGNIFAPFDRYLYFEKLIGPFLDKIHEEGKLYTPSEFIHELGLLVDDDTSIVTWAARNDIPIFSPALTDGSLGDLLMFKRQHAEGFTLDMVGDSNKIMRIVLDSEKTGAVLLGGGVAKHFVLNANIFKEGLDFAVYVTTAAEYDASDSGGNPQEAITWAKIKVNGQHVKIVCDASIAFPLIVAGSFREEYEKK